MKKTFLSLPVRSDVGSVRYGRFGRCVHVSSHPMIAVSRPSVPHVSTVCCWRQPLGLVMSHGPDALPSTTVRDSNQGQAPQQQEPEASSSVFSCVLLVAGTTVGVGM